MGAPTSVRFELKNKKASPYDLNVERGVFLALHDLIEMDNGIKWDPVGLFFLMSCGISIYKYKAGLGAVYDSDGAELFLTQTHIDKLFAFAESKKHVR